LLFYYGHASGIILKKNVLDLSKAKKYIGFLYIQEVLVAQAIIAGNTLRSSKVFAHCLSDAEGSDQVLVKGRKHWHPVGKLNVIKFKIRVLYDITKKIKDGKKIRDIILYDLKKKLYDCLYTSLVDDSYKYLINPKGFLDGISIIITMKELARSPKFWLNLIIEIFLRFFRNL